MSTIGIVGAGHLGAVLARRLVRSGHLVRIANSRGPHTLTEVARETGAEPAAISDVGTGADVLIVAIPLGQAAELPTSLIEALPPTAIVIDTGNYVPARDGRIDEIENGMPETAWVAEQFGVPVVKAFNNITDHSLACNGKALGSPDRIALPVSGDDPAHRATAMRLVENLGFDSYDSGPLSQSWRQQIGQAAYCTDPTRAELERLLHSADPATVQRKREGALKIAARMPEDFPKADLTRVARLMAGLGRGSPSSWLALARMLAAMVAKLALTAFVADLGETCYSTMASAGGACLPSPEHTSDKGSRDFGSQRSLPAVFGPIRHPPEDDIRLSG